MITARITRLMGKSIHHSSGFIMRIMKTWAQSMMAKPIMETAAMVFMPVTFSRVNGVYPSPLILRRR